MSPRIRVVAIVSVAAVAAAAAVVGVTLATRNEVVGTGPATPRSGAPPLVLDLGVRADREATALREGERLYARGRRAAAGGIFARYPSLEARVGGALAAWPDGTIERLRALARARPRSALVQLNLGLALLWAGRRRDATAAWRAAARRSPDSPYAVRADDLLHPDFPRGIPLFVPSFGAPRALEKLSPAGELAALARAARRPDVRSKLLYGVALQRLGRRVSAEREFAAAATLAPQNAEAQTAAAVGRFRKGDPSLAFSRLGPLVRQFPRAPTVRFHLGLLLLWLGQVGEAKRELRLARAEGPESVLGREANAFLRRLEAIRTR